MSSPRPLVLVGPTAAGKSTLGRALATRLGRTFVDLDDAIAAGAGMSVADIFATQGEAVFRRLEAKALAAALDDPRAVIATGAGAVLDGGSRAVLQARAHVLHLHADVALQVVRAGDGTGRPLLADAGSREAVLHDMARVRTPLYEAVAHARLPAGMPLEALLDVACAQATLLGAPMRHVDTLGVDSPAGPYPIHVGSGLLRDGEALAETVRGRHVLVVCDANTARLQAGVVEAALRRARPGITLATHVIPAGEAHKTLAQWQATLDALATLGATRDATVVALGGGVVGDLAGFAAACWMRGIDVVQVPTTLLAMVDSSVGGKTAVDVPAGKNLVGAFHPPRAVVADTATLATLPDRELRAGLAEVVKYGAMFDAGFLQWLDARADALLAREPAATAEAVLRSCRYKADVVARDPFERGERALLNFGHTFGHAIEAEQGYGDGLVHGEAVAVGMVQAATLAARLGLASEADAHALRALLQRLGLPVTRPAALLPARLLARMRLDKKADAAGLRFVLWDGAGRGRIVRDVPDDEVLHVLA